MAATLTACAPAAIVDPIYDVDRETLMQHRAEALAALAVSLQVDDPPDVALVRFVERTESGIAQADCLVAGGFPATASSDGTGFTLGQVAESQAAQLDIAIYTCMARYTVDPRYNFRFKEQQLRILYDYFVGELTDCLEEKCYAVGPPPSFGTFKDQYETAPWSPYSQELVTSLDPALVERLFSRCPQSPPDDVLYPFDVSG